MTDGIKISLDIVNQYSDSLKTMKKTFDSTFSSISKSLESVSENLKDAAVSITSLSNSINNNLGRVSLNNLALEIAATAAAVGTLQSRIKETSTLLERFAGRTITIAIAFKLGWDVGTWIRENVTEPIRIQNENVLQEIVSDVADVSTEALKKLDEIYRQSGDSVRHFAKITISEFESLRSRATGEVEQLRKTLDELEGGPDIPIVRNQIAYTKTLLENGERLLSFLDKNKNAIDDLRISQIALGEALPEVTAELLAQMTALENFLLNDELAGQFVGGLLSTLGVTRDRIVKLFSDIRSVLNKHDSPKKTDLQKAIENTRSEADKLREAATKLENTKKFEKKMIFDSICEFLRLPVWYNCTRELRTAA